MEGKVFVVLENSVPLNSGVEDRNVKGKEVLRH